MTFNANHTKAALIAPAGKIINPEVLELGRRYLENLGYQVVLGEHIFSADRYMAGTDHERAADVMAAYQDPEIKIIFTAAGAAGCQRILPLLDYELIAANPKPLVGLSDITALQLAIWQKAKVGSLTGMTVSLDFSDGHINPFLEENLLKILKGHKLFAQGGQTVIGGTTEGILVGGCLSLLRNLCGTEYYPDLTDKILVLEDVGERIHKIDLMLTQLKQNPGFSKLRGIIFGQFFNCIPKDDFDGDVDAIISDFCQGLNIPVIKDFPYGHIRERYVLPIGAKVKFNADTCVLEQI